ncbi:TIGR02680 family protein [Rhodococcus sp. NPDC060086]|uniref:TIGR02680 family protein n=1 Tax=Rhodococcus sp. NPDC060086 TaxID=3347055 RepID=UPI0036549AC4
MTHSSDASLLDATTASAHPQRWKLSRAGIVNVWHYLDTEFTLSDGRMILRGTNGSGKSRALEMLLPFLLDADRKRMDATGAGKVDLDELMRIGAGGQNNRVGYLWLELSRPNGFLTIGAQVRYSATAHRSEVYFFTAENRVGADLPLVDEHRVPLSRDDLAARIGADRITRSPEEHRDTVRELVFGLHGESGRDRYTGLLQLLHTLRSPDVGNRIDEGRLPQILSDALPPLNENMLAAAGDRLDLLGESRAAQTRLESALTRVRQFHAVYRRYAADLLRSSADDALQAADRVARAEAELDEAEAEIADLDAEAAAADTRLSERRDQLAELDRAIRGLESHALFRSADDLAQRALTVDALGRAADQALHHAAQARRHESLEAERADTHLADLSGTVTQASETLAAAKLRLTTASVPSGALPDRVRLDIERPQTHSEPVRARSETVPEALTRPTVAQVRLVPDACDDARVAAEQAAAAARRRKEQASRRLVEARRLELSERGVRDAESESERAAHDAEREALERDAAARALDDAALELEHRWREWLTSERTTGLSPHIALHGAALMQRLVDAAQSLSGDDPDPGAADTILGELVALTRTATPSHLGPTSESDTLEADTLEATDSALRSALLEEQRRLESEEVGPPMAPWRSPQSGVPLWRAVDFVDTLGDDDRAGIESALLAAGFLTATVDGEGRLRAHSGQILVSPRGEPPRQPLSVVLQPDPDSDVPVDAVASVLSAIGFEDASAVTSVSRDGRWHNGVLRGRHTAETPGYIGEAARSRTRATRRARLDEITGELARLDRTEKQRAVDHRVARAGTEPAPWSGQPDAHVTPTLEPTPTAHALYRAYARARAHAEHATRRAEASTQARERAAALRSRWAADLESHRTACAHFDLPTSVADLDAIVVACAEADAACTSLARDIGDVLAEYDRFDRCARAVAEAIELRAQAEEEAESRWHEWHDRAAVVAAQSQAVDVEVADLAEELRNSETERARTDEKCRRTLAHREQLGKAVAAAMQQSSAARERLTRHREELEVAAGILGTQRAIPALSAAADVEGDPITRLDDAQQVRGAAETLLAALPQSTDTGDNRVLAALQRFDREISDQLDIEHTVESGAHVVRLSGAGSDTTPTSVLAQLTVRAEEGRAALSQREHDVFTGFVLGGVADELRRRITQAESLIAAMNNSLAASRTSHGIGVRIGWHPVREDADAARITELLTDSARSIDDSDDLIELLRHRVEVSHDGDPSAGYAAHLSRALDYRTWHTVDVTIIGPEPDQERRISKRAKISQGETRFVSYVALFAAADGYLSGLPDTDLALRMVLLDDAFAKIDEPTIGELMGLLVRQDIDFVMTGHALWGCVPQVPALDIYEVRRLGDSSAVTTRVHWDGRSRHVRAGG